MKYYTQFCCKTTFVANLRTFKCKISWPQIAVVQKIGVTVLEKCHHHKWYLFLYDFVTLKGGPWRMESNIFSCCVYFFQSSSPNNFYASVSFNHFAELLAVLEVLLDLVGFAWFFVLNVLIALGHLSLIASIILAIPSSTLNDQKWLDLNFYLLFIFWWLFLESSYF